MRDERGLPKLEDGWSLTGLKVNNLRALAMSAPIEMRRLMLVVGRNGIGKSTLARVFPLLRQSTTTRAREPLLWWDEGGVDFGSFDQAVRRGQSSLSLDFTFSRGEESWSCESTITKGDAGSRVGWAHHREGEYQLKLSFDESGLSRIDGLNHNLQDFSDPRSWPKLTHQTWRLFGLSDAPDPHVLEDTLFGFLANPANSYEARREITDLINRFPSEVRPAMNVVQQAINDDSERKVRAVRRSIRDGIQRLRLAETMIQGLASKTGYVGPFRAVPQRFYRSHGVAVDQLDSHGGNLAMYIAALAADELDELNQFLTRALDATLTLQPDGASIRLMLHLREGVFDLIDTGFGYSQVLPVAVHLWASSRALGSRRGASPLAMLVVEQPELHLHPHHQTLVARAFAGAAAEYTGPMVMVETHSDHFVSEIGLLVGRGKLPRERVGVLCVEPREQDGADVRMATFDEDGVLHDWPLGFLSP